MKISVLQLGSYGTNCYLVWDESANNAAAIIDPGDQADVVLDAIRQQNLQVQAILLTHGHFDHVGAVAAIQAATGCKVYLHAADLALPADLSGVPLKPTNTYDEGDTVQIGTITFHVLHTPGHTPGSVCLIANDVLFSGDTLFAGSCGRTDFEGGSWQQMEQSLRRLDKLEGNYTVFPGHMGSSTLDRERRGNLFLAQARMG